MATVVDCLRGMFPPLGESSPTDLEPGLYAGGAARSEYLGRDEDGDARWFETAAVPSLVVFGGRAYLGPAEERSDCLATFAPALFAEAWVAHHTSGAEAALTVLRAVPHMAIWERCLAAPAKIAAVLEGAGLPASSITYPAVGWRSLVSPFGADAVAAELGQCLAALQAAMAKAKALREEAIKRASSPEAVAAVLEGSSPAGALFWGPSRRGEYAFARGFGPDDLSVPGIIAGLARAGFDLPGDWPERVAAQALRLAQAGECWRGGDWASWARAQ